MSAASNESVRVETATDAARRRNVSGDGTCADAFAELTDDATEQADRVRRLQRAAAIEWLEAEATLRAAESDLATPPAPPPPSSTTEPVGQMPAGRRFALPAAAATVIVIVSAVALFTYTPAIEPAIASRGAAVTHARPATAIVPATVATPEEGYERPAAGDVRDGTGDISTVSPVTVREPRDDFGVRVYGRFAKANAREKACLARAVYYEARGEGFDGKVAVAQVVLNRARSKKWPDTICGVVHQGQSRGEKCQFSYVCFDNLTEPAGELWDEAKSIAEQAVAGQAYLREFEHATHYHTTAVKPVWRANLTMIGTVGSHVFYNEPGGVRVEAFDEAAYLRAIGDRAGPQKPRQRPAAGSPPPSTPVTDGQPAGGTAAKPVAKVLKSAAPRPAAGKTPETNKPDDFATTLFRN